ncbi:MAG: chemotaxis response regulator protein-glutamate methylesterase [Actinobacteria bacterium]|nr:MAG: chemotaxis response regulator protein-glutamate methylesterase [Actinomycetota bacterium]
MVDPIKVLIVDDSALMRTVIGEILDSDRSIEIVGTARTGLEAIDKAAALSPDVVTLDIEMPELGGLEALGHIMRRSPTRVIMLSGLNTAEVTYEALSKGAVDFISKPSGPFSPNLHDIADELLSKVHAAADVNLAALPRNGERPSVASAPAARKGRGRDAGSSKIVAIGSSTGGPAAVERVLAEIPDEFDAAVLVIQHLPVGFSDSFVKRLARMVSLDVTSGETGQRVSGGRVYVAPAGSHMTVTRRPSMGPVIQLDSSMAISGVRPAADRTMESVARVYGERAVGVLLTGMGSDGAMGMQRIKENGGVTIAQDEKSCIVYGMPRAAVERGVVDKVVPLHRIAGEIRRAVEGKARGRRGS